MVGGKIMLELWDIDINKEYYVDDDDRIWDSEESFCDYYQDEYIGTKDDYEDWCTELMEYHDLQKYIGKDILHKYVNDLEETIDAYRGMHDRG